MTHELYRLLTFLDHEALVYRLDRAPPDAVVVSLALAGERLEITVTEDAEVQFLRFTGDDDVGDASPAVARLYQRLRTEISD
jgi:hypothetical protein